MKISNLSKIILVVMIILGVVFVMNPVVFAADDDGFQELDLNDLSDNTTTDTNTNTDTDNNTIDNNTTIEEDDDEEEVLTTNNVTSYNENSLPDTGLESSVPVIALGAVLVISAAYAYKKMQDYKGL